MPKDAPLNSGAPEAPLGSHQRVSGMQTKLHRWAVADHGRRFDDLFNLGPRPGDAARGVRTGRGQQGSPDPGCRRPHGRQRRAGTRSPGYLEDLQRVLKTGEFRPLPVRERKIPKPGEAGRCASSASRPSPTRVVQAALKLVLEPIFEADFLPVSDGFRPMRRAHDAIAGDPPRPHQRRIAGVLDADIEACFDSIDHTALMDRVRARVKDKRVLRLVKAFLKAAGVLTEGGGREETFTGISQGGILSRCWRTSPRPRSTST